MYYELPPKGLSPADVLQEHDGYPQHLAVSQVLGSYRVTGLQDV